MKCAVALTFLALGPLGLASAAWADSFAFSTFDVPGASITEAFGVNDAEQIVGRYSGADTVTHGFLYTNSTFTPVNVPGAGDTHAKGINDVAQIVGSFSGFSMTASFIYDGGNFTIINMPGSLATSATGINNSGQVVGTLGDGR